jgi:glycosyltransferase involved in cell wall biosynthesis
MSSGSVLVVDDRGGWKRMVEHGVTGWLCNTQQEFIYYASRMAFDPALRAQMARAARKRGDELGGLKASMTSWRKVFREVCRPTL